MGGNEEDESQTALSDAQWQDYSQWALPETQGIPFTHKRRWELSDTETGSLGDCEASTLVDTQNTIEHKAEQK